MPLSQAIATAQLGDGIHYLWQQFSYQVYPLPYRLDISSGKRLCVVNWEMVLSHSHYVREDCIEYSTANRP